MDSVAVLIRSQQLQTWAVSCFVGFAAAFVTHLWLKRQRGLPPGPIGLPLLGYLPFLGKEGYLRLHSLALKYGPVFSLYLGRKLVVVLGNYKAVKEFLSNRDILDRPEHPPNHLLPESSSLSVANGTAWKTQRQFSFKLLRHLGMGKARMEEIIHDEIKEMLRHLSSNQGRSLNLDSILLPSVSNNIYTLLSGHRLDVDSEDRRFLNKVLRTMTLYFRPTIIHAYFPWLKWWMVKLKIWGYYEVDALMKKFGNFVTKQIENFSSNVSDKSNVKNYMEGYILAMRHGVKAETSFNVNMLKGNYLSIFGAGSTPSRATMEWALVCMLRYKHVQKKVQEELDAVVGRYRLPVWADHQKTPYTMAVIMEVMRSNTTIPISMLRCTAKDTKIGQYFLPKGTIVMTNLWGVHHHPDDWTHPSEFRPDRFLRNGQLVKPPQFIPFSYGKRNCPGEDLAIMLVFLYTSSILQNFTVSLPPGSEDTFPEDVGIAKLVVPNNICLLPRDK